MDEPTTDGMLLQATDIVKHYGAVRALRGASLAVRTGEVHALMGANGAGKSTMVKILTGAIRPTSGDIAVRGEHRQAHSPAEARRGGVVSVYQEPALIPDLDIDSNLRLTSTPVDLFDERMHELGIPDVDKMTYARDLPLATLRIIDLARALSAEPDVLLLDEMTAALPADLSDKVLKVVGDYGQTGRSVVFISHRLLEISNVCDRATVLRDGKTVGVLDMGRGAEDEIVSLMLGPADDENRSATTPPATPKSSDRSGSTAAEPSTPRLQVRDVSVGNKLRFASLELHAGEVLGLVGLEGQGQDELFDIMAGARKPDHGELLVEGKQVGFGHPADAIAAGIVYVPANRAEALLPQRSVRENIALPFSAPMGKWGPISMGRERERVDAAIERLQIDTRAQGEVSRLSGGNQQKVTVARWIAGGVQTMLCFDPTRGIDIRTKRQIYQLLRDLAAGGAAVMLYTSELEEIQATCDRTLVIFGGEIVDEMPASEADEPTLMRAAHGLQSGRSPGTESTRARA